MSIIGKAAALPFKALGKGALYAGQVGLEAGIKTARTTGKAAINAGKTIGKTTINAVKNNSHGIVGAIGFGATAGFIGADLLDEDREKASKGFGAAAGIASIAGGAKVAGIGSAAFGSLIQTGVTGATLLGATGKKMINMTNKGPKLSKFGAAALTGASLISAPKKIYDTLEKSRMGTHDGTLRTLTPQIPQVNTQTNYQKGYLNNAGATGDLVFALNNLR